MTLTRQISLWARGLADPDAALLSKATKGDRTSFDMLVRRHEKSLRGFLVRRVGQQAMEDVFQETLIACWSGLPKYAGTARFKAWLFGIAVHKCTDHYRRSAQLEARETETPPDLIDKTDAYETVNVKDAVKAALSQLPEAQREVLELYYYAELTMQEIAVTLNRNLNTVKYQFYQAHAKAANDLKCLGPQTP